MNNARRKEIRSVIARLSEAGAIVDEARETLETLKEEEEEYRDAMPESLQAGEKYDVATAAIDQLENALEMLGGLSFDDLSGTLEEACS